MEERVKGRLLVVRANYELFNLVFINIYAPNSGPARVQFLNELSAVLSECEPEEFLFLGGDFNCTQDDELDRNHREPHAASKRAMTQLITTHSLSDIWREHHTHHRQRVHTRENLSSMAGWTAFIVLSTISMFLESVLYCLLGSLTTPLCCVMFLLPT